MEKENMQDQGHMEETAMTKVLIIEDEGILALNLKEQVREMGHHVVGTADTAEKALVMAKEHGPDIALVDLVLKGQRHGQDLGKTLSRKHGCSIIFMSGSPEIYGMKIARGADHVGFLKKPFGEDELMECIRLALEPGPTATD